MLQDRFAAHAGRALAVVALLSAALACSGGGGAGEKNASADPLAITTESLADAYVGKVYAQALGASGGHPPYAWSVSAAPQLPWLSVATTGSSTASLGGIPAAALLAGAQFTLSVTDQAGETRSGTFILFVKACAPGDSIACKAAQGDACLLGGDACVAGDYSGLCSATAPSQDASACGASCGPCGAKADTCRDGRCTCGGGATCGGATEACCAGACKDLTSTSACGACGNDCGSPAHADVSCVDAGCQYACAAGYRNCAPGSAPRQGCETDVWNDAANCGDCGHACATDTATATLVDPPCSGGLCHIACKPGQLDCDGVPTNGCETAVSATSCAGCGVPCAAAAGSHTIASCKAAAGPGGVCTLDGCVSGWGDCDQNQADCETDLTSSMDHCGACGVKVTLPAHATAASCVGGAPKVTACATGWTDCNGAFADGCEAAPGAVCCAGQACFGACVSDQCCEECLNGTVCCSGTCTVNPKTGYEYCK